MVPITSAPNHFVHVEGSWQPVYRIALDGELLPTPYYMAVMETAPSKGNPVARRHEQSSIAMATAARNLVRSLLPNVVVRLMTGVLVDSGKIQAIGNGHTNWYVVLGDKAIALAPAWILLCNSVRMPSRIGQDAGDIELQVSTTRAGIWGEILDYRDPGPTLAT